MKKLVKSAVVVLMVFGLASSVLAVPITSGLVVQLDMSSVTTDGSGNVTAWNDLSGNGNDAVQGTSGLQPILVSGATLTGENAVEFDGTNDYLGIDTTGNSTLDGGVWTMFIVHSNGLFTGSGSRRLINFGYADINPDSGTTQIGPAAYGIAANTSTSGIRGLGRNKTNGQVYAPVYTATNPAPEGMMALDAFYIATASFDGVTGTNMEASLIGAMGSASSGVISGLTAVGSGCTVAYIGCGAAGSKDPSPGNYFDGSISEVLVYNRVLSSAEKTSVNEYLYAKYIPEPATISLLVMGAMGLFARRGK